MGMFRVFLLCSFLYVFGDGNVHHLRACNGVEYPNLGCFEEFSNTGWRPQSPDFVGTTFHLFTRRNPTVGQLLDTNDRGTIRRSFFDGLKDTKILIHGFLQNENFPFLINTTRSLLHYGDMNVIVVGWGGGAGFPYGRAAANTRLVGAQLARLLFVISEMAPLAMPSVHLIGHSLGAHVAGYTGARMPGIGRITALDPAQPNFHGFEPVVRLDTSDATFVDVIHTDGNPYNTVGGYGMIESVGHIDFYPNGGHHQPGCHDERSILGVVADAFDSGVIGVENHISCSHERSVHLFAASIDFHSPCTFRAFECDSEQQFLNGECTHCGNRPCPIMGFHADRFPARGMFYLNTTDSAPFCGHHYFVSVTLDQGMDYTLGILSVKLIGSRGQTGWFEIKSGQMNAGDVISKMVLDEANVGVISSVKVKFIYTGSMLSWGSESRVTLRRVTATNLIRVHPKYFCQQDMVIEDRQELTLSTGSFLERACNNQ